MLGHPKALSQMVYLMWTYGLVTFAHMVSSLSFYVSKSSQAAHLKPLCILECYPVVRVAKYILSRGSQGLRVPFGTGPSLIRPEDSPAHALSHCPLLSSRHCLACIPVCSNTSVWYFHWAESQAGPEDTECTLLWMDATVCGDLCQSLCFRVNVCVHASVCVSERKKRDFILVATYDSLSQGI